MKEVSERFSRGYLAEFERRTSCEAACVHEEVAIADSECPLYKKIVLEKKQEKNAVF